MLAAVQGQPQLAQADEWRWRMFVRASISTPLQRPLGRLESLTRAVRGLRTEEVRRDLRVLGAVGM
ncbi:MAG: hypothetical protein JWO25_1388 [Alphaproteobacteria bacterium]|nr:hypothetical protein [Alphaproteobacteria bacterium]